MNHVTGNVGQPEIATVMAIGEFLVVQAHQVQDGCVQIMDGGAILYCFIAKFVGATILDTTFDATAGKPHGEGVGVVIAAGTIALRV